MLGVVDAVVVAAGGDVVVPDVAGAPEVVEAAGAGADVCAEPVAGRRGRRGASGTWGSRGWHCPMRWPPYEAR